MNAPSVPLVLQVQRQEAHLSMSVYEQQELASTIRQYSQRQVDFAQIHRITQDAIAIVSHASKTDPPEAGPVDSLRKTGQLLWDHLLTKSAKEVLRAALHQDLILFLDEELISIPWELLYDGRDFLSLKFNVGRLVRSKQQTSQPRYRSAGGILKMLILANPSNDLQSAYLEGLHIKNRFDRHRKKIRIDFKSTHIDTLYVKKNLRDYDIVHFAGHCEYDEDNYRKTGWVLSDGRFTVADILQLGEGSPLPSLIFSNACQSAKVAPGFAAAGYQQKSYSLASAFLFSGARHYIGSIWKIEDAVSLAFAEVFYAQLLKGSSVGECMRQGRLALLKGSGSQALPWASYLLYGDPTFTLFKIIHKPKAARVRLFMAAHHYKKTLARSAFMGLAVLGAILLCRQLPSSDPRTYLAFNNAQALFQKGKNQQVIDDAVGIIKQDPLFLPVYPLLAQTYQRLGKNNEALKCYFEYALQSEKRQDSRHLAGAYIGIGWLYQGQGEYAKALDFYHKAIAISREHGDKFNEAAALRKLAVWHIDREELDKALELLLKSSEINRERKFDVGHRYNLACDYFDLGIVFVNKDDLASAKEFYQKSCDLFKQLKLKSELSDYYFNLGEIFLFEKQYQKALECYETGLKIDQVQGNMPSIVSDYSMLGELYVEMGNTDAAEKSFLQSVSLGAAIQAPQELASTYYSLGLLYKQKGQKNKAREYLRRAQEIYRAQDSPLYQKIRQAFVELNNPS